MDSSRLESFSFIGLFIIVSVLLFFVFAPFIQILTLAAVLAILLHHPYERLTAKLGGWRSLSAGIVVGLVLIFFITPLFFLSWQILLEAQSSYTGLQGNGTQYIQSLQNAINHPIRAIVPTFSFNVGTYLAGILGFVSNNLAGVVSGAFYIMLETFLMLLTFFFFLRDGRGFVKSLYDLSPFRIEQTQEIFDNIQQTITSIIKGTFVVALIRWILISIGFTFFGIPNVILWGSIGGIVGAVPGLGTPFAFIPAIAYLYFEGSLGSAAGLAIFGVCVIMVTDNILTPYFFGKGLQVPPMFVLFAILGGILFFGPLGFILGPLVLSVFLSVIHMYSVLVKKQ
jgi:predicted PurR-regulated permease PerM